MTSRPCHRKGRFDRLFNPGATAKDIEVDVASSPFDRACRDMDRVWGTDQLPGLVSVDMAARYGRAVAALNAAIEAGDPVATAQNAANCVKGLAALHSAAETAGAPKANPAIWEYDCEGFRFGIMADDFAWQAAKAARPDLLLFSMREVANALRAYQATHAEPSAAPQRIASPALNTRPPFNADLGGDFIPF